MFQVLPLQADAFRPLYGLTDAALAARGVVAETADKKPGFPCRVSLRHAEPGERVLLLNHVHQPADTPFRASHAIYVLEGAETAQLAAGELPEVFKLPTVLSIRAFDDTGMLRTAELVDSVQAAETFEGLLMRDDVHCLHVHFAKYGCFAAQVVRA